MQTLTPEQQSAVTAMLEFLSAPDEPFFVLSGFAGTGKTFSLQRLVEQLKGRLVFTAPTNKATKVLRSTLTSDTYKPECRTIYSLLGLRLEANGEVKELAFPEDPLDLTQFRAIIIDEASMLNRHLLQYIQQMLKLQPGLKFIFMGDEAQLPPVGESRSPVWRLEAPSARLSKVMRHDNSILAQATAIRQAQGHPAPRFKRLPDFSEKLQEGVRFLEGEDFRKKILEAADAGEFFDPTGARAVAWRNVTVDALNALIRSRLFHNAAETPWLPTDRFLLMAPAKDLLLDELLGTTDDEGSILSAEVEPHPQESEFLVWHVTASMDTGGIARFLVLHKESLPAYNRRCEELAAAARLDRRLWKRFWAFKESFHQLRHCYALTAHRAQGSTYDTAFVDWRDILLNRDRAEAFRCLYVAATRAKRQLIFN